MTAGATQPGVVARRTIDTTSSAFDDICRWLQQSAHAPGPVAWPVLLLPDLADPEFRFVADALGVYHRVEWTGHPTGSIEIESVLEWRRPDASSDEIGVASSASIDGRRVARSLLVVRSACGGMAAGTGGVPPRPALDPGARRRRSLVLTEADVAACNERIGNPHPLYRDPRYAHARGYPNTLVPGLILLLLQFHYAAHGGTGAIETWFRRPVPVGSALEWRHSTTDESVYQFHLVGSGVVTAVARMRSVISAWCSRSP